MASKSPHDTTGTLYYIFEPLFQILEKLWKLSVGSSTLSPDDQRVLIITALLIVLSIISVFVAAGSWVKNRQPIQKIYRMCREAELPGAKTTVATPSGRQ